MKYFLSSIIILLFSFIAKAQQEINIHVDQPPLLQEITHNNDTIITIGDSIKLGESVIITGGSGNYQYSWTGNSIIGDPNIKSPVVNPSETTEYVCTVVDERGCSFDFIYKIIVVEEPNETGIEIIQIQDLDIILSPNPNHGKFKVKLLGKLTSTTTMSIFDNNGRFIQQRIINEFDGKVDELFELNETSGIYHLFIESNGLSKAYKFIIE